MAELRRALSAGPRTCGQRSRLSAVALLLAAGLFCACHKPYRVGEYVFISWTDGRLLPAYIKEKLGRTRYRVHFDVYDCEVDVNLERIYGRVQGPVPPPSPADRAPCGSLATRSKTAESPALVSVYKPGDRIRVTWRGSVYPATILEVVAKDQFKVHYDGFEAAWDEVIAIDRVVSRKHGK